MLSNKPLVSIVILLSFCFQLLAPMWQSVYASSEQPKQVSSVATSETPLQPLKAETVIQAQGVFTGVMIFLPLILKPETLPTPPTGAGTVGMFVGNRDAAGAQSAALSVNMAEALVGKPVNPDDTSVIFAPPDHLAAGPITLPVSYVNQIEIQSWQDVGDYDFNDGLQKWNGYHATAVTEHNLGDAGSFSAKLSGNGSYIAQTYYPQLDWTTGQVNISVWAWTSGGGKLQLGAEQNGNYCYPGSGTTTLTPGWNTPSTHNLAKECQFDTSKPIDFYVFNNGSTDVWVDAARFEPWIIPVYSYGYGKLESCGWRFDTGQWGCAPRSWVYIVGQDGKYPSGNWFDPGMPNSANLGAQAGGPRWVCPVYLVYYEGGQLGLAFMMTVNSRDIEFRTGPLPLVTVNTWSQWNQIQVDGSKIVLTAWLQVQAANVTMYTLARQSVLDDMSLIVVHQSSANALANTIQQNWWFSTNHAESPQVMTGLAAMMSGNSLSKKGDGRSSGSVEMWMNIPCVTGANCDATLGIAHIVNSYVHFVAFTVPLHEIVSGMIPPGSKQLTSGSRWYYTPSEVGKVAASNPNVKASWRLSAQIGNTPQVPLEVGHGGYARWLETRTKYGLNVPIVIFYFLL